MPEHQLWRVWERGFVLWSQISKGERRELGGCRRGRSNEIKDNDLMFGMDAHSTFLRKDRDHGVHSQSFQDR
jgi:hypothetical protein